MILKVALPVPIATLFDYLPPDTAGDQVIRPGLRVEVPFGRQRKVGLILALAAHAECPSAQLRKALSLLDAEPLMSAADLALLRWSSHYYHHAIGEVAAAGLGLWLHRYDSATPRQEVLIALAADSPLTEGTRTAPRQQQLWSCLLDSPGGLKREDLTRLGLGAQAKALIAKGRAAWTPLQETRRSGPEEPCAEGPALTSPQARALDLLRQRLDQFHVSLLFGITGSGKTEVYLRLAAQVIASGRQVLVLVPEINLTPQLEARFRQRLPCPVEVLHSSLPDRQRAEAWHRFRRGDAAVLLGTRSATFVPARRLGLIILDEEHDASFKQQEGFRFSARDVAIVRGRLLECPVILGSATPSLESFYNAQRQRYSRIDLPTRAGGARPPTLDVIDIRGLWLDEGLSPRLIEAIADTLDRQEQVLLFLNRRGYAPTLTCHQCGWLASCPDCACRLVSHKQEGRLKCHHCGRDEPLPPSCPACGKADLVALGLGTERVEIALGRRFSGVTVARIDRDSIRGRAALDAAIEKIRDGRTQILIGTQMLAKGHDFPNVTLVGILDVDGGLFASDFRAGERLAQTVLQVAGRAGRATRPGRVLLQTRHPDHPLLDCLLRADYPAFLEMTLNEREALDLPPFSYQALIRADSLRSEDAHSWLTQKVRWLAAHQTDGVQILGPVPAPLPRRSNRYRWQCLVQARQRSPLHHLLSRLDAALHKEGGTKVRWSIDVDPCDLY